MNSSCWVFVLVALFAPAMWRLGAPSTCLCHARTCANGEFIHCVFLGSFSIHRLIGCLFWCPSRKRIRGVSRKRSTVVAIRSWRDSKAAFFSAKTLIGVEYHADAMHLAPRSVDTMQTDGSELYQIKNRQHESFCTECCRCLCLSLILGSLSERNPPILATSTRGFHWQPLELSFPTRSQPVRYWLFGFLALVASKRLVIVQDILVRFQMFPLYNVEMPERWCTDCWRRDSQSRSDP